MKTLFIAVILALAGCMKNPDTPINRKPTRNCEVCVEVEIRAEAKGPQADTLTLYGHIGKGVFNTKSNVVCGLVGLGDSVSVHIKSSTPRLFVVRMYENGRLLQRKSNSCPYDYYFIFQKF